MLGGSLAESTMVIVFGSFCTGTVRSKCYALAANGLWEFPKPVAPPECLTSGQTSGPAREAIHNSEETHACKFETLEFNNEGASDPESFAL